MRPEALAYIDRVCTDQDLLRLTSQLRHWKSIEEAERKKLAGEDLAAHKSYFASVKEGEVAPEPETKPEPMPPVTVKENIDPGDPAITKLGQETRFNILTDLKDKFIDPARYMRGQYSEHLKLLWKRGEIKFDGTCYYL